MGVCVWFYFWERKKREKMNPDNSSVELETVKQAEGGEYVEGDVDSQEEYGEGYDETIDNGITLQEAGGESQDEEGPVEPRQRPYREQDIFLPIANVARIMKNSIPQNGKIAKEAKECVQECVSEFISFITSEAAERCQQEKRKTINGEDILFALNTLGFDPYVEPLKLYLTKYRESVKGEKTLEGEVTPEEMTL